MFSALLEKTWWAKTASPLTTLLTPFSALYGVVIAARRELYSRGILARSHPGVPVLVVGNVVVGGAGKTPVVQAIVRCLQQAGYRPGIISRGYPVSPKQPRNVTVRSIASDVAAAMSLLEQHPDVNILVADDALQHYALMRDIEVEVISAERRYGNGKLMPAGPLREPRERARECNLRLMPSWVTPNGGYKDGNHHVVRRKLGDAYALIEPGRKTPLSTFAQSRPAIAAGIANPRQFYDALLRAGVQGQLFGFSDHYNFRASDFDAIGERAILMTEKDAAKCRNFADRRMWVVPLSVHFAPETKRKLLLLVREASAIYAPAPVSDSASAQELNDGPQTA